MLKNIYRLIILFFFTVSSVTQAADQKLKDFRGTGQKAALIGVASEFVDVPVEEKIVQQMRKSINRYTRSYGDSSIAGFTLGQNTGKQFFKTAKDALTEPQKKFLQAAAKDNSIDIIVLGTLREAGDDLEAELQLYDVRIDTLSKLESAKFSQTKFQPAVESLVFRVMNYMDKDGSVNVKSQDLLEAPPSLATQNSNLSKTDGQEFAVNPTDLGRNFAGPVSVGGEKTPFWETWWFWTLVGGGLATAGGLTYYFMVADQPPSNANVTFHLP